MGIYKEDRLVGHRFMTGDPMDCLSRGNLSWSRQNIFRIFIECDESEKSLFKVSSVWVNNFMHHNRVSLHCKRKRAQQDPERLIDKLILFILYIRRHSFNHKYSPSSIIAMNEICVSNGMVSNNTIH